MANLSFPFSLEWEDGGLAARLEPVGLVDRDGDGL